MKRALSLLAFCALLVACGPQGEQGQEGFPIIDAPTANTSIGPDGAAGIAGALPMSADVISDAAPQFIVAEVDDQIEGQAFRAITLSAGDEEVFRVLPTADGAHIHSIVTVSTQARGPNDEVIGIATFGEAPAMQAMFCGAELVEGSPGFACSTAEDGRFWRVYRLPEGYEGPSDPFAQIDPDAALAATLYEMRWIAPRVGEAP